MIYQPTAFEVACANIMTVHLNIGAFVIDDQCVGVFPILRVGSC